MLFIASYDSSLNLFSFVSRCAKLFSQAWQTGFLPMFSSLDVMCKVMDYNMLINTEVVLISVV